MAIPNANWDELASTTLEYHSPEIADNVTKSIALLVRLEEKGNVREYFQGGKSIVETLEYATNSSVKYYQGYEKLDLTPSDILTAAEFTIKQAAGVVMFSGLEEIQNRGKAAIFDLMESRVKNLKLSLRLTIGADLYSDGTGSGGKQITGLGLYVPTAPTSGVVGGIDRSAQSWWQSKVYKALTTGGAIKSASNIVSYITRLSLQSTVGQDKPDLGLMDNNDYEFLLANLQARQILQDSKLAELGFDAVRYRGIDFVCDGGDGGGCDADTTLLLNTSYLRWRPVDGRNFKLLNPDRYAIDQDAVVKIVAFAGNLTITNSKRQGRLTNT